MLAWQVTKPGPSDQYPLERADLPVPEPGCGELLLRVLACAVCRTDLHVAEGDLPVHRPGVVPGHEIVGRVEAVGPDVTGFAVGDRAGVAWLRYTDGTYVYCGRGEENLCPSSRYTGWDEDGGYTEPGRDDREQVRTAPGLRARRGSAATEPGRDDREQRARTGDAIGHPGIAATEPGRDDREQPWSQRSLSIRFVPQRSPAVMTGNSRTLRLRTIR